MVTSNLFQNVKISVMIPIAEESTASSTAMNSTDCSVNNTLDMAEYEGVLFIAQPFGVIAGGTLGIVPRFGSSSGTLVAASTIFWAGTSTLGATTMMNQEYLALDIVKPIQRYVGVGLIRSAQIACASVIAIQYGKHTLSPTTSSTGAGSNWLGVSTASTGGYAYACGNSTAFGFGTFVGTTG